MQCLLKILAQAEVWLNHFRWTKMMDLFQLSGHEDACLDLCIWKPNTSLAMETGTGRLFREDADNLFRNQHLSPQRFQLGFVPVLPSFWMSSNETLIFACFPSHGLALQCWSTGSQRSWQELGEKWTHTGIRVITAQVAAQCCQYSDTLYTIFCSLNTGSLLICEW